MANKTPSHSTPAYVVRRVRALLKEAGHTIHIVKGRYFAFGPGEQHAEEGFDVHVVGFSNYVAVSYDGAMVKGQLRDVPKEVRREKEKTVREFLSGLGYRIDDRGWIACDRNHDGSSLRGSQLR